MDTTLKVTVSEVKYDDNRVIFNFVDEDNTESWCVDPLKNYD